VAANIDAIFLDRDGTLIENRHFVGSPDQVCLLPGAREGLARAVAAGARLFLFTNQSGVGRGYFTMHDVGLVNDRMIELLDLGGDPFTRVCVAPERPDQPSVYRKPSPRFIHEMLLEHGIAADRAWMLGDSPSDWEAGLNAGIRAAAIVPGAESDEAERKRLALGVAAYGSVLDWIESVLG
jgi:D-glycero-D-manno-heptose 1,7-bisphosphate phosphatase